MPEHAQILRIVVASPGDVTAERDIVQQVAEELNRGIAADRGLRLEVIRWETDAYPGFHPEGPQGLIDTILRIEDCDAVIGIFGKRFGTRTAEGATGTEHEIRCAYEGWRKQNRPRVMVYFNQKAYTPQSREETDQWGRVLDFKEKFPKEGLWWPYKGRNEFEPLLRAHLTNFILDQFPAQGLRALGGTGQSAQREGTPQLTFGTWTLHDAVARNGSDWSNSTLKVTSENPSPGGLDLEGYFEWRLRTVVSGATYIIASGTEHVKGRYVAQTRTLFLEGYRITSANPRSPIMPCSYSAVLSEDGRTLSGGTWGSVAGEVPSSPGRWSATR